MISSDTDDESFERVSKRFSMQIDQMLSSYQSKYKTQPIDSLLISSSCINIGKAVKYIDSFLPGVEIKVFDTLEGVVVPDNLKEKSSAEPNPSVFSSVMGLATRKLDVFGYYEYVTGANNVNLLPDRDGVKNQEKMKFLSRWGVVIFVVFAVVFGAWSFFSSQVESDKLNQEMIEYQELESQKIQKEGRLLELTSEVQALSGMLDASSNISSNQKFMHSVLLSINSSFPQGVSISKIEYTGGSTITITGLSISDQNILQFIENLSRSAAIDKASLLTMSAKTVNKRTFKSFTIRCTLAEQTSTGK